MFAAASVREGTSQKELQILKLSLQVHKQNFVVPKTLQFFVLKLFKDPNITFWIVLVGLQADNVLFPFFQQNFKDLRYQNDLCNLRFYKNKIPFKPDGE